MGYDTRRWVRHGIIIGCAFAGSWLHAVWNVQRTENALRAIPLYTKTVESIYQESAQIQRERALQEQIRHALNGNLSFRYGHDCLLGVDRYSNAKELSCVITTDPDIVNRIHEHIRKSEEHAKGLERHIAELDNTLQQNPEIQALRKKRSLYLKSIFLPGHQFIAPLIASQ